MTHRARGRVGAGAVIAASVIAAVTIVSARKGASAPGTGVPPAARPLFYDRPIAALDPEGRSLDEVRLMRNTIYARARGGRSPIRGYATTSSIVRAARR